MARAAGSLADPSTAARIAELEARLREAEETLEAIRSGEVDAVVVGDAGTTQVYTIESADRPYRVLIEQMAEGAVTLAEDGTILYCNRRFAEMLGVPQERATGGSMRQFVDDRDEAAFARLLAESAIGGGKGEVALRRADSQAVTVQLSFADLVGDGRRVLCGIVTDLTLQQERMSELSRVNDRLAMEMEERARTEDMLRQSQKMEAVGQLTGGLAHDFNNLLAGISGSLEIMDARIRQGRMNDVERYLVAAQGAARRAAALTHRLLAFSRRQTLAPRVTDIDELVAGMAELIRGTVGPAVRVDAVGNAAAAGSAWRVEADPNQLENALLNLCINARDAMPEGGRIVIATDNRWLDARAARERDLPPGPYVILSVSDTGTGMPPEVVARAFDPFFTTKPIGVGTGLGLSMVYGFVRQSGGTAWIVTEPGQGTTIELYLPRHVGDGEDGVGAAALKDRPAAIARATVLVVDDEPLVRMFIVDALRELGHGVLEAGDGPSGLVRLGSTADIDLLITDMGLPNGMNGRQVADAARNLRPGLKVLFVTGYTEASVLNHEHFAPGMGVLTKPFGMDELTQKVSALLTDD